MIGLTVEDKAKIFDWIFIRSVEPKHAARLDRTIMRDQLTALVSFRAWGTDDEIIAAILKEIK